MISRWVVHPFLIAIFPALFLYAHNADQTAPREILIPSALALAFAVLAWVVLGRLLRSFQKAGIITSAFLILFFSSAHINVVLNNALTDLTEFWVPREVRIAPRAVLAIEFLLFLGLSAVVALRRIEPKRLTAALNLFSLALVAINLASAAQAAANRPPAPARAEPIPSGTALPTASKLDHRPDIYYIILDGYARGDVMKSLYGLDNAPFLKHLEEKGFYIARQSRANYCQTPLCMASALNCQYLGGGLGGGPDGVQEAIKGLIGNNTVIKTLKQHGYRFVTFSTGFDQTDHPEADLYLSPHPPLTEFQWMLVATTPLTTVLERPTEINPYRLSRTRTMFLLNELPKVARMPEATFTFAHIVCPHPPFVFGPNGEDVSPYDKMYRLTDGDQFRLFYGTRDQYIRGYHDQAAFITAQVTSMIDKILSNSPEPPIIILQSDHGSGLGLDIFSADRSDLDERMSILNAYYLPYGGKEDLYQTITPVNSFRVVLRRNFGVKLDLLQDKSYYSSWPEPLKFFDVTARLRKSAPGGAGVQSGGGNHGAAGPDF